ncbi:MAG: iron uptake protein [Rhizobacter sp.]
MAAAVTVTRFHVVHRIAAALLGGYAFCWGLIALGVASLFPLGMEFHDAESLSSIVAFLVYVVVFCWAFMARSLPKVWLILAGGGALMAGLASLFQHFQL